MTLELKVPPVLVLAICILCIYIATIVVPMGRINLPYPRYGLLTFTMLGLIFALLGVHSFKRHSTTVNPMNPNKASSLVCTGVYAFSRNPMYVGMALICTGFAWYFSHVAGVFMILIFVLYMTKYQIKPEEEVLKTIFNDEFEDYCKKVRRWL